MIVHLVSYSEGVIREVRHLDLIRSLPSLVLLDMSLDVGDRVSKTVDIRTDSGYVLLCNDNNAQLQSDFEYIIQLQKTMFDVEDEVDEMDAEVNTSDSLQHDTEAISIDKTRIDTVEVEEVDKFISTKIADEEKVENSVEYVDEDCVSESQITSTVIRNSAIVFSRLSKVALRTLMKVAILYVLGCVFALTLPLFVKAPS